MIQVSEFVRLRKLAGHTQVTLAADAGVSQQLITEIEKGRTKTSKAIYRLAAAMGVEPSVLDPEIPVPKEITLPELRHILLELESMAPSERNVIVHGINAWITSVKKTSVGKAPLPFPSPSARQKART